MSTMFGFCLRFLISFFVAKLLLRSLDLDRIAYLLGLSLLFTLNLYWFDFAKYSDELSLRWMKKKAQKNKPAVDRISGPPESTQGKTP